MACYTVEVKGNGVIVETLQFLGKKFVTSWDDPNGEPSYLFCDQVEEMFPEIDLYTYRLLHKLNLCDLERAERLVLELCELEEKYKSCNYVCKTCGVTSTRRRVDTATNCPPDWDW